MQIQQADGFNPNDSKYKSCCCHSKTFTIVIGILEIFTICFVLVAVLPDINSRICDTDNDNSTSLQDDIEISDEQNSGFLHSVLCKLNIYSLIWAILQIVAVNVMFYGIKTVRYLLFIPHVLFRFATVLLLMLLEAYIIYVLTQGNDDIGALVTGIVLLSIFTLFWIYATWIEIRCSHFIKRSNDTGFSISIARPIGPATISLNEHNASQSRQLPPLRHTRNYVANERNDDKLGD